MASRSSLYGWWPFHTNEEAAHADVREQVKKAHHMTRLMVHSAEESMRGDLSALINDEREARVHDVEELRGRLQQLEERLLQPSVGKGQGHDLSQDSASRQDALREVQQELPRLKDVVASIRVEIDAMRAAGSVATSPGSQASPQMELQSIRALVDQRHKDLLDQIGRLKIVAEHSAVRAGFLAVAASECNPQEKAWLFNKLKAREDAINSMGRNGWQSPSSSTDTQMLDVTQRAQALANEVQFTEFDIQLDRRNGGTLGVTIDGSDGRTLLIEKVDVGLVQNWNQKNPGENAIRPFDKIVACNGTRNDSGAIADEASKSQMLTLTIQRSRELIEGGGAGRAALARFDGKP